MEFVGRFDLTRNDGEFGQIDPLLNEMLVLAGVAFAPHENVRIIPNLWWFGSDVQWDEFPEVSGKRKNRMVRVTIDVSF